MVIADERQDAAPSNSAAVSLKKDAATPPQSDMPLIQVELIQIEPATAELPAAASSLTTPVPVSLPEGPTTITAEQIGRPSGRFQHPAGNPFITVRPAPDEAEPPRAADADLQATMNLAALPVAQTPTPLLQIESRTSELNAGESRQPALPLRAGTPIDASVRVNTVSTGETAGLAFAARLVPLAATAAATAPQTAT